MVITLLLLKAVLLMLDGTVLPSPFLLDKTLPSFLSDRQVSTLAHLLLAQLHQCLSSW